MCTTAISGTGNERGPNSGAAQRSKRTRTSFHPLILPSWDTGVHHQILLPLPLAAFVSTAFHFCQAGNWCLLSPNQPAHKLKPSNWTACVPFLSSGSFCLPPSCSSTSIWRHILQQGKSDVISYHIISCRSTKHYYLLARLVAIQAGFIPCYYGCLRAESICIYIVDRL